MRRMTLNKNGLKKLQEYLLRVYPDIDIVVEDGCIKFGDLDVEFVAQVLVEDASTAASAVVEPNPASMSGNTMKPMGIPDPAAVKAPVKAAEVVGKAPGSEVKAVGRAAAVKQQEQAIEKSGDNIQKAIGQAFDRLAGTPNVDQLTMSKAFSRAAQEMKKPMIKPAGPALPSVV